VPPARAAGPRRVRRKGGKGKGRGKSKPGKKGVKLKGKTKGEENNSPSFWQGPPAGKKSGGKGKQKGSGKKGPRTFGSFLASGSPTPLAPTTATTDTTTSPPMDLTPGAESWMALAMMVREVIEMDESGNLTAEAYACAPAGYGLLDSGCAKSLIGEANVAAWHEALASASNNQLKAIRYEPKTFITLKVSLAAGRPCMACVSQFSSDRPRAASTFWSLRVMPLCLSPMRACVISARSRTTTNIAYGFPQPACGCPWS